MGGPVSAGRQFVVAAVAEYWVREQELVMVGEMPVERSAQPILLLYLDRGYT